MTTPANPAHGDPSTTAASSKAGLNAQDAVRRLLDEPVDCTSMQAEAVLAFVASDSACRNALLELKGDHADRMVHVLQEVRRTPCPRPHRS
jgi:hypothetical protein